MPAEDWDPEKENVPEEYLKVAKEFLERQNAEAKKLEEERAAAAAAPPVFGYAPQTFDRVAPCIKKSLEWVEANLDAPDTVKFKAFEILTFVAIHEQNTLPS
jgi:hypothetical protein